MRQAWLAAAMLLAGAGLLVSAGYSAPTKTTKLRRGGTLRVALAYDIDNIDPSLAYSAASWHIEYSTALKLFTYPDAPAPRGSQLVLEGASSYRVSRDGRTYTFRIRNGFRFSNGAEVTARNYKYALDRVLIPNLDSRGRYFISDLDGTNVANVTARRNKLTVELWHPDGGRLLSILALPYFQAIPLTLPRATASTRSTRTSPCPLPVPTSSPTGSEASA